MKQSNLKSQVTEENKESKPETKSFPLTFNRFSFLKVVFLVLLFAKVMGATIGWWTVFFPYILEWVYTFIMFIIWMIQCIRENKPYYMR